jgi:FkbM family methyltransferase
MSRFDRAVGLARSLAIYHAIPLRQRRMRSLYRSFVRSGDLVFDIGAHVGNRTRAFASIGCRVVAVEPQPDFARVLRTLFGRSERIEVIELAVASEHGRLAQLSVSERTPTVTTLANGWREARAHESEFAAVRWNRQLDVTTTTLDRLIERFGVPAFTKIDVEGSEASVLAGVTQALPALSFEYLPTALDQAQHCLTQLSALGRYRFNWSPGESYRLAAARWVGAEHLIAALRSSNAAQRSGDVYARLTEPTTKD